MSSVSQNSPAASEDVSRLPESSGNAGINEKPRFNGSYTNITEAATETPHDTMKGSIPKPVFGQTYDKLQLNHDGLDTQAKVAHDGRVNINIDQRSQKLSNLFAPTLRKPLDSYDSEQQPPPHSSAYLPPSYLPPSLVQAAGEAPPPMNLVIQVVGSRGDVQPFISLGQVLKNTYGHRVRLATHLTFKGFVEDNGLEFFNIGGDPSELMAFMVKNPGLVPGIETLRSGDVGKRRKGIAEILEGCWRSCVETGDGTSTQSNEGSAQDHRGSSDGSISFDVDATAKPFVADALISNPAGFAHIHIAEKLGIPLHMMFTMPWSPTQAFPHPLANIQSSNADANITNFISYAMVEMLTWQGLGDVINRFREKTLHLEPVSVMWAPGMLSRLRVPWTYCWSPALIPKPHDWGSHIDIAGFYFLSLASSYHPPPDLVAFLESGPPPVYIGFGSIVVDDPDHLTRTIFDAVKKAGVRALVSKGWGKLGTDELGVPEDIFMLGNVPHDWLFNHVSAVVHHGGAGTTAAGVSMGKPTMVVPFFGDQPFWGSMIATAGAGPQPIPYKNLTADNLAASILKCLEPTSKLRAAELGAKISKELGAEIGAKSFHSKLGIDTLRCSLVPSKVAAWRVRRTQVRLSALAAAVLGKEGLLDFQDLKLYRPREYNSEEGPWDPISGGASALIGTIGSLMMGIADVPIEVVKALATFNDDSATRGPSRQSSMAIVGSPTRQPSTPTSIRETLQLNSSDRSPTPETQMSSGDQNDFPSEGHTTPSPVEGTAVTSSNSSSIKDVRPSTIRSESSSNGLATAQQKKSFMHKLGKHITHNHLMEDPSGSNLPRMHFDCPACKATVQAAAEAGSGVGRVVEAGLRSPMEFTLAIARGFHNAPKLYGDTTVRSPEKVTGIQSGLKVAGKEFGFGVYDGIVGLVTQPYEGAKADGAAGLLKGLAKGVGGLILKPSAAIWALPGYTFQGIFRELQKSLGHSTESYIIASRTAQGMDDAKDCSEADRLKIIERWNAMQHDIQRAQQSFADETRQTVAEFQLKRRETYEETKRHWKEKKTHCDTHLHGKHSPLHGLFAHTHHHKSHESGSGPPTAHEFETAIKSSVAVTSKGYAEQDEMIERAIRASVAEMLSASQKKADEHEALERALAASISEAKVQPASSHFSHNDEDLKEALQRSLHDHQFAVSGLQEPTDSGYTSDGATVS